MCVRKATCEKRHRAEIQRVVIVTAGARDVSIGDRVDDEKRDGDEDRCQEHEPHQGPGRQAREHTPSQPDACSHADAVDDRAFPTEVFVDDEGRWQDEHEPETENVLS